MLVFCCVVIYILGFNTGVYLCPINSSVTCSSLGLTLSSSMYVIVYLTSIKQGRTSSLLAAPACDPTTLKLEPSAAQAPQPLR